MGSPPTDRAQDTELGASTAEAELRELGRWALSTAGSTKHELCQD